MRTAALFVVALVLSGCHGSPDPTAAAATTEKTLTPAQLSFLHFEKVAETPSFDLPEMPGTIEFDEQQTAPLHAIVPGRVVQLLVQVGDHVDADQPLIVLDSPDVKLAQADYVRAEADLTLARKAAARATVLRPAQAIAEKDYFEAQENAVKATADFERARAQLERLHVAPGEPSSRYVLRAPFAGTVVERRALVGMEVGPDAGEPPVIVSDLSRVRVVLRVPERHLPLLHAGQAITVRVDAYPSGFPGEVTTVGDVVDEATRTVPVRCTVANPDHLLKPAMFARATVKPPAGLRIATVPTTALLSDGNRFDVIVRGPDGVLTARPVEVGAEAEGRVQILDGVAVGEEIVSEGAIFARQALAS